MKKDLELRKAWAMLSRNDVIPIAMCSMGINEMGILMSNIVSLCTIENLQPLHAVYADSKLIIWADGSAIYRRNYIRAFKDMQFMYLIRGNIIDCYYIVFLNAKT